MKKSSCFPLNFFPRSRNHFSRPDLGGAPSDFFLPSYICVKIDNFIKAGDQAPSKFGPLVLR
jgi:hypothetical protein